MQKSVKASMIFWAGYFLACISSFILMMRVDVTFQAAIFLVLILVIMRKAQTNGILHPISWFSIFFYLYTISYPMYVVTVWGGASNLDLVIPISMTAYVSFVAGVVMFSPSKSSIPMISLNVQVLTFMTWMGLIMCVGLVFYAISLGATSKREFIDTIRQRGLEQIFSMFLVVTVLFCARIALLFQRRNDIKVSQVIFDRLGIGVLLTFIFAFGVTGERDYIFRLILLAMIVVFSYRLTYKYYYLVVAVFALVLILPFTQAAKGYLISDSISYTGYQEGDIFNTEFASAGRNIHYVIERQVSGYGLETYIRDVKRYLNFLYSDQQSTTAWFNDYIRNSFGEGGTSGWGFSLVAEGYVSSGWYGPMLLFLFVGILTGLIYKVSTKNDYAFLFYLIYIPTLIYVLRADFGNLLSLGFKVNLLIVALIFLINKILVSVAGGGYARRAI